MNTFKNGIFLDDCKEGTRHKALKTILPKEGLLMVYPMAQNGGVPPQPIVKVGDKVRLGQKIADSEAFFSVPIHASVSGEVVATRKTLTPAGLYSDAVVIKNDGKNVEWEPVKQYNNYRKFSSDEIISKIREAGVVGLGGAGFPTHVKLSPPKDKKIDAVIVNASECEPYLTSDHRALLDETERVLLGVRVVLHLFPEASAFIGIENNKKDAFEKLKYSIEPGDKISLKRLVTKYPQGSEKQLIYACLKREVPQGGLPCDAGVIVINVDTLIAVERAILRDRPLIRKIITLDGGAVANPGNYRARIGMSYKDFLEAVGGLREQPAKMLSGGPMMGVSMFSLDVPIIKTSSAFLCFTEREVKTFEEKNCIRCAYCLERCPMGLMPLVLNKHAVGGAKDAFVNENGMECIECGACSYICPAKRHLTQSIRVMRRNILEERRKK